MKAKITSNLSSQALKHVIQRIGDTMESEKEDRTDKAAMPGRNPAQAHLSQLMAQTWKRIMVQELGAALQAKLNEFSHEI